MANLRDLAIDFVARKLASFSRLCSLRDLDLQFVGIDEILSRHAETARSHLLDCGSERNAFRAYAKPLRFLTAFTCVGAAANAVHCFGERGVGFPADGAKAHRSRCETPDDVGCGLDILDRDRRSGRTQIQQASERQRSFLFVDLPSKRPVFFRQIAANSVLQVGNAVRRPGMRLLSVATSLAWLALRQVLCVGGSWLVPHGEPNLKAVEAAARRASALHRKQGESKT